MEQKINFQKRMEEVLEKVKESSKTPSLLLHSCCGPCSSYVLECLKEYFRITVFYYNPNIFPEEEYEKRLSEQRRLIDTVYKSSVGLLTLPYDHAEFLKAAEGLESEPEGGARCTECFRFRLEQTAKTAKEQGFDYFATTLTVSPHKNAMILNRVGHEAEEGIGGSVLWLESDFKKKNGYLRSIEISKETGLYRQTFCGCEYSSHQ